MFQKIFILIYITINMTLYINVISALLTRDTQMFSNMDPYAVIEVGSQKKKTKTHKEGGKKPKWNEILTFKVQNNVMKITVMDQDPTSDDVVASATVDLEKYLKSQDQVKQVVQLSHKGKSAGKIQLSIKHQGEQGSNWGNQGNQGNQSNNQQNNQFNQQNNQFQQQNQFQQNNQQNQFQQQPPNSGWGNNMQNNQQWNNPNQGWGNMNQQQGNNFPNNQDPNFLAHQFANNQGLGQNNMNQQSGWNNGPNQGNQGNWGPNNNGWGQNNQNSGW